VGLRRVSFSVAGATFNGGLAPEEVTPILDPGSPSSLPDLRRRRLLRRPQGFHFALSQLSLLDITLLRRKEAVEGELRVFGAVLCFWGGCDVWGGFAVRVRPVSS
jgi:hypothetical protein